MACLSCFSESRHFPDRGLAGVLDIEETGAAPTGTTFLVRVDDVGVEGVIRGETGDDLHAVVDNVAEASHFTHEEQVDDGKMDSPMSAGSQVVWSCPVT